MLVLRSENGELAYQTTGSAGVDVSTTGELVLLPGAVGRVGTGCYLESCSLPAELTFLGFEPVVKMYLRSSTPQKLGVGMANSVAIIDSDYRGEIQIALYNFSDFSVVTIPAGTRIAQLIVEPVLKFDNVSVKEVERGAGGFGSTDKGGV